MSRVQLRYFRALTGATNNKFVTRNLEAFRRRKSAAKTTDLIRQIFEVFRAFTGATNISSHHGNFKLFSRRMPAAKKAFSGEVRYFCK